MLGLFSPPWRSIQTPLVLLFLFTVLNVFVASSLVLADQHGIDSGQELLITPSSHAHLFRVCPLPLPSPHLISSPSASSSASSSSSPIHEIKPRPFIYNNSFLAAGLPPPPPPSTLQAIGPAPPSLSLSMGPIAASSSVLHLAWA